LVELAFASHAIAFSASDATRDVILQAASAPLSIAA
jgi:hypothetical protein